MGNYDEAVRFLEKYSYLYLHDPHVFLLLGAIWFQRGETEKSEEYFRKALELKGKFAPVWSNLGIAQCRLNNFDRSLQYAERALRIDEGDGYAWLCRAKSLEERGNIEEACKSVIRALTILPRELYGWNLRGILEFKSGDYRRSLESFTKASEFEEKEPGVLYNRAVAALACDEMNVARKCNDRSIFYNNGYNRSWYARAVSHKMSGDEVSFAKALMEVKTMGFEDFQGWFDEFSSAGNPVLTLRLYDEIPIPFELAYEMEIEVPEPIGAPRYDLFDDNF